MAREKFPSNNRLSAQSAPSASSPSHACLHHDDDSVLIAALNETAMVAVTDTGGRIVQVNDRLCSISGYRRDELVGRSHRILKSGEHSTGFFRVMYNAIAAGQTWRGKMSSRAKDGRLYWVDLTVVPRRGSDGAISGYTSVQVEIDAPLMADAARGAPSDPDSPARPAGPDGSNTLKLTLSHMSQGLSVFDERDNLIVWNDRFAEIYRFPASLLCRGMPARALSAHLSLTGFVATDQPQWRQLVAQGQRLTANLRALDGRIVKVDYTPVAGSGWVATHDEITEQVRVQTELSRQKEQLARINMQLDAALENMSQGICLLDADGRLVLTNRRLREMYGWTDRDLPTGMDIRDLIEKLAGAHGAADFSVDAFLTAIPSETDRMLPIADGRVIHIHRAPTPDGGWVATHEDITERERISRQITYLAYHDALTGLANRAEFTRKGGVMIAQRGADGTAGPDAAVLLIDLDRFKSVNDTFGHAAGDRLLAIAADRMRELIQPSDIVARLGGDEFAILQVAHDDRREAAVSLAARLIESLARPFDLDGRQALVGASIGIALRSHEADTIETLLDRADLALYEVKSSGRNSSRIYDDLLGARAHEKHELEADLRKAIGAGEFELHYQPIVSLLSREICGVEGLLRWRHPDKGLLAPDRFIQLAEDSGLIVPLGEFVIRQACNDATNWPDHIKVAINISPTHIKRRTLLDTIAEALLQSGLDADRLEIEVTETVLMQQDEDILSELHQLRHLGLTVALDDFGTGFSSLSHLRMFSFDKVKIDRTFVAEITERPDSAAIVCAVTGLARALGMVTTAEGIETEHQAQILLAAGCTQGQGYLFGKAQPAAQLQATFFQAAAGKTVA